MNREVLNQFFRKELDRQKEAEVLEWLFNPANREEVMEYLVDLYNSKSKLTSVVDIPTFESVWERINNSGAEPAHAKVRIFRNKWAWASVAASIIFLAIGTWMGYHLNAFKTPGREWTVESKTIDGNKLTQIALYDGSRVTLAANTHFTYHSNDKEHATVYLDGAAFFEIKKGKKEYTIKTQSLSANTSEGKINVSAFSKDSLVKISVKDGKAELIPAKKIIPWTEIVPVKKPADNAAITEVTSNEQAIFDKRNSQTVVKPIDADTEPLLMLYPPQKYRANADVLIFSGVSLDEFLRSIEINYHLQFVKSKDLRPSDNLFSGKFNMGENPFNILIVACRKFGLTYEFKDGTIFIKNVDKQLHNKP